MVAKLRHLACARNPVDDLAMDWRADGILLAARRHGESAAIAQVFTESKGLHAGVVRGGASRRIAPILQPGAQLDVAWRARSEEQLGTFTVEPLRSRAEAAMGDRLSLAGLNAVCALLLFTLPEREAHPRLYRATETLMDLLGRPEVWPLAYLRWEILLLEELGYGLDLTACAVTGATEGLVFVSPRTGRAVTREGAGEYAHRLLPLPPVLLGQGEGGDDEVAEGLLVTGHFLADHVAPDLGRKPLPDARARLAMLVARRAARG